MAGAGQSRAAASAPSTASKDRYMSVISHNSQQVTSLFFLQFLGPTIPQDLHIFHKIDLLTGEK